MGIDEFGTVHKNFDACRIDVLAVKVFEARDFLVLAGDEHVPVEMGGRNRPAEACGVDNVFGVMARIDEQFLRDAAADDAGATERIFLGDCHARARLRRESARAHAARTAADDEEIVVIRHLRISSARR